MVKDLLKSRIELFMSAKRYNDYLLLFVNSLELFIIYQLTINQLTDVLYGYISAKVFSMNYSRNFYKHFFSMTPLNSDSNFIKGAYGLLSPLKESTTILSIKILYIIAMTYLMF